MAQTSRKHALIIVDLQKDFLPGGALAVPGGDKIVPVIREVLEKNSWDCIVMTQDWHPAGHVSFARNHEGRHVLDVIELPYGMQMLWPVHCVEGTDGAAIEGVDTMKADLVLRKGRELNIDSYSAFCAADNETMTGLHLTTASRSPQSMQLAKGSTPMSSPTPPPRSTPTAALRRPKPPGDLPASTCAGPRMCSSPSTDANTTHQSLKAAPVSRLGRPFSLLATGGVGFGPASTHPIRRTEGGKGGVRGGQLNEILVS